MPSPKVFDFAAEMRRELEESKIPMAIYQYLDGRIKTILVSDGLVHLQAPGVTREALMDQFTHYMYKNVHPKDAFLVATKAKEFASRTAAATISFTAKNFTAKANTVPCTRWSFTVTAKTEPNTQSFFTTT